MGMKAVARIRLQGDERTRATISGAFFEPEAQPLRAGCVPASPNEPFVCPRNERVANARDDAIFCRNLSRRKHLESASRPCAFANTFFERIFASMTLAPGWHAPNTMRRACLSCLALLSHRETFSRPFFPVAKGAEGVAIPGPRPAHHSWDLLVPPGVFSWRASRR